MGETSAIQWTDATWNPWHGCHKISPGCANCYMYADKKRYGQDPSVVTRSKTTFNAPLKWKEPKKVFTCSWSDFFIEEADAWREEAWDIIRRTPHTYQILTKRVERVADHLPADWGEGYPNVWLGATAENQEQLDNRMRPLLRIPAAVRFLSCEPLLGPIDLNLIVEFLGGSWAVKDDAELLHWVIGGGESGPGARFCYSENARSLRDQCTRIGIPYFWKQWGEFLPDDQNPEIGAGTGGIKVGKKKAGRLLDGREWNEFPR